MSLEQAVAGVGITISEAAVVVIATDQTFLLFRDNQLLLLSDSVGSQKQAEEIAVSTEHFLEMGVNIQTGSAAPRREG